MKHTASHNVTRDGARDERASVPLIRLSSVINDKLGQIRQAEIQAPLSPSVNHQVDNMRNTMGEETLSAVL